MSIWEIGMLAEKKRIEIELDTQDWIDQALDFPGIQRSPNFTKNCNSKHTIAW